MPKIFRIFFLCTSLLSLSIIVFSQSPYLHEQHLPGTSASANNFSSLLLEDGRIWIASYDGLQVFDGYSFKTYDDPIYQEIPTELISILKDKNGYLWCLDFESMDNQFSSTSIKKTKSIAIFDPSNDRLIKFEDYIDTTLLKNNSNNIHDIYQDDKQDIWILKNDGVLLKFTQKLNKTQFKTIQRHERIFELMDKYYHLKKDSIIEYTTDAKRISQKYASGYHSKIQLSPDSILYLTTVEELNTKNYMLRRLENGNFSKPLFDVPNSNFMSHNFEYALNSNKEQVFQSNLATGETHELLTGVDGLFRKAQLLDSDNFYFPSSTGLHHVSSNVYPFEIIKDSPNESNRYMTSINDSLLLYSSYSGAKIQNLNSKVISDFSPGYYFGMAELPGNILLFGNQIDLFVHLEILSDGKIKETILKDPNSEFIEHRILFYDKSRDLTWIGSERNLKQIDKIDLDSEKIYSSNTAYNLFDIKCFYLKGDTLSIGTANGLYEIYADNSIQKISNINQFIYDIERTTNGTYYLATQGEGLLICKPEQDVIQIDESSGLSDRTVYSLEIDDEDFIWAGTQNGLSMIDPNTLAIQSYYQNNGLSNNEFNYTSSYVDDKSKFYFGSVDGIISFYPSEIREKRRNENAQIELLELKSWDPKTQEFVFNSYKKGDLLEVPAKSRSIKLTLSLDNISYLRENLFQYKIPGFIDNWKNIPENTIELTNLPAGLHDLIIRTKFSLTDETVIPLRVKQFFYYTWWFVLLSFILPILAIRYYFQKKNQDTIIRQKILEKEVKSRTVEIESKTHELELSNKSKDQIISILAHDLRSPLLSLNDVSQKISYLIEQKRTENLQDLGRDLNKKSHNLQRLVDNMLHWAVFQSGSKNSVVNSFNIDGPIIQAIELYDDIAKNKNIKINYELKKDIVLFTDLNIFQTVIRNLLDNAIKYSPEKSAIHITCTKSDSSALISVIDQGKGVDEEIIQILYTMDLNHPEIMSKSKGTGLGLSICKHLLNEQGQELHYTSNTPTGSIFSFSQKLFTG